MQLIRLISLVVPVAMVLVFILVLVKVFTPARPQRVVPPVPGHVVTLHALLLADAQPGTFISAESLRAPSGHITLTAQELIWEPDDRAHGSWRSRLTDVRAIERPSFATGRLVLLVQGRLLGLVVDEKKRPNRFSRDTVAKRRQARTGTWFADLVDASAARAWASL